MDEEWKIGHIEHTKQTDGHNCGVFCINFASQILRSYPVTPSKIIVPPDLGSLRQSYTAILLKNSEILEPKIIETDKTATKDVPDRIEDEESSKEEKIKRCLEDKTSDYVTQSKKRKLELLETKEETKTKYISAVEEFREKYHARLYERHGINKFKNSNASDSSDESMSEEDEI